MSSSFDTIIYHTVISFIASSALSISQCTLPESGDYLPLYPVIENNLIISFNPRLYI